MGQRLERLVSIWPAERSDDEIAEQLGNLMWEATVALGQQEVGQIREYLCDIQALMDRDIDELRAAMHDLERRLPPYRREALSAS